MGIEKELQKNKVKKEIANEHAISMYKEQLQAITNIADTDWYKEIKSYWERELDSIKTNYPLVTQENLHKLQEKDKIATSFLYFLNNLEDAKQINKQAKV